MLFLFLAFVASGDSSDSAARSEPRDTAQQSSDGGEDSAAEVTKMTSSSPLATFAPKTVKPETVTALPPEGAWGAVIALLRQIQKDTKQLGPVCRATKGGAQWIELLMPNGEWKAAVSPAPGAQGVQVQQLVACDVVKPWIAEVQGGPERLVLPPAPTAGVKP